LDVILKHYQNKNELTDWEAVVLGINGVKIKTPWFGTSYFKETEKMIKERDGELRLVTDYIRIALAYRSHGKDPANIAGFNFTEKIINFENIDKQGVNAYTWALIALNGQGPDVTRPLIENMLEYRTADNGFSFKRNPDEKSKADMDLTAMAVTALAPYTEIDEAVTYLINSRDKIDNCETAAQVIIALCSAGIEPDAELIEIFDSFKLSDGFYTHTLKLNKADEIATRQAALALTALKELLQNGYLFTNR
jgi:hypothetical protein